MVKVMRTGTTRYKNVSYKPYQEFIIDDKDKEEMVKLGCVVIEDKVVNTNKVAPAVEPKVEPVVEKTYTRKKEKED